MDIPPDLRPAWRIGIIVLLLRLCCRDGKARFRQLHVLSWAVRTRENRRLLTDAVRQNVSLDTVLVRIEPSLNRAVDLAIAEGLVNRLAGNQIQLSPKGSQFCDLLLHSESVFKEEKEFMSTIKKKVSEAFVNRLFG